MTRKRIRKTDLSLLTYQEAVELVAENESPGDAESLKLDHVSSLVGVVIAAWIYGVEPEKFGRDVIKYRRRGERL